MELSKLGRAVAFGIVALFVIAMAAIVASSAVRGPALTGPFQGKLKEIEAMGLNFTALAPKDVYGEDAVAALIACPGLPKETLETELGMDTSSLEFEDGVIPRNANYIVTFNDRQEVLTTEKLDNTKIDLCMAGQLPLMPSEAGIPLAKTADDFWQIAAGN